MKSKLTMVMFAMSSFSEWQSGVQNRNFHILQHLIKDERIKEVITIDYLPPTWKRFYKNWHDNLLAKPVGEIIYQDWLTKAFKISERLKVFSSVISKISVDWFYKILKKFLAKEKITDFIVWSAYPLEVGYFKKLPAKLFVFDTVDNWTEHPSYRKFKQQLLKNYQVIDEQANLIFTVSTSLRNLYENVQKVHWISNGVDLKHYQQQNPIINRDIGDLKKPIIGYVGTIQDRLDLDLLKYLAQQNQDKSFVLIGPVWYQKIKDQLEKYPNIHFLGRKAYQEIPMYLQQFAVGIIPHKVDRFIKSTNPMKMYEYLACQKPVVATSGGDTEIFKDLIYIADDYQQFNDFLNRALREDNKQQRQLRLARIKDYSWLKKVEEMLSLIEQKS